MTIKTTRVELEVNSRFVFWDGLGFSFILDFTGDVGSSFERRSTL